MIDINNKIFRNTYGSGFATLLDVAINNALHSQFSGEVSTRICISDTREPVIDAINSGVKMRVDRAIEKYEY
jgi:phage baseplate assembly protein W